MNKLFSFNDFVSKFDVVTNIYLSSHQEIHRFLDILRDEPLDEKYEFVFPLFYDFKISNNEVYFLPKTTGEPYEWLIRDSVKKQVEEHTKYRVGITESYCRSDIEPSYLKMKQSNNPKTIDVKIEPYKDYQFCKTYLTLSPCMTADELEVKEVEDYNKRDWDLGDINAEGVDPYSKTVLNLRGIEKGIIAHYPIIQDGQRVLYYFFTNNLKVSDERKCGFGGLFVIAKEELKDPELGFFMLAGYTLANKVALSQIQYTARVEAVKSAVAALMARNLSHNLGSHPLTNTKNYFRGKVDNIQNIEENKKEFSKTVAADYRGSARLLQYIQERMDFIATIISGDQYPLGGLNFKAEFFDILTNDDCGARHGKQEKNFLLQYLLYSEKLTRHYGLEEDYSCENMDEVKLVVKYNGYQPYTGEEGKKEEENDIKLKLSKLRLAVPGGVMARHALFTIVENILRNAAKHSKHEGNLELTIKIEEDNDKYTLLFYDNCNSANTKVKVAKKDISGKEIKDHEANEEKSVIEVIREKLNNITIIGDDAKIDKNDKGLKEMLFCAIWLKNEDLSKTLFDIQNKNVRALDYIDVKKVDNDGNDVEDVDKEGNLCYVINLDKWQDNVDLDTLVVKGENDEERKILTLTNEKKEELTIARMRRDDLLKIHADFVVAKQDYIVKLEEVSNGEGKKLSRVFPSFFILDGQSDTKAKINEIQKNFCNDYNLVIKYSGGQMEKLPDGVLNYENSTWKTNGKKNVIFYDHLLNEGNKGICNTEEFKEAWYFDSISGENFTQTLTHPEFLSDLGLRYKVIRSAKAKIAIVDERIWENHVKLNQQLAQDKKSKKILEEFLRKENWEKTIFDDLRQFNFNKGVALGDIIDAIGSEWDTYDQEKKKEKLREIWNGISAASSEVADKTVILLKKKNISFFTIENGELIDVENKYTDDIDFDFVSIHLGLLDKSGNREKIKEILDKFCKENTFISIHSGRGNFSPDLEDQLKDYPFISLSALESALNNSKFLLSEFLYNINYYGKGNFNNK